MISKFKPARVALAPALAAALALGLASCGSDSGSDSSGSASSGGGKAPIKIFLTYTADNAIADYADMKPATEAAVDAINKDGGVNGAKLELSVCNNRSDQAQALTCARDAVKNGTVAMVGSADLFSTQTMPVLETAGIPTVGMFSFGNEIDGTSKANYPLNGGSSQGYLGLPMVLNQLGVKSYAVQSCEYPSCKTGLTNLKTSTAKVSGLTLAGAVQVPNTGVTDYSSYAAKTKASNPEAVVQIQSPAPYIGLQKAGKSIDFSPTYWGNDQQAGESDDSAPGAILDGFNLSGPFPSPRDQTIEAMKQYATERAAKDGATDAQNWLDTTKLGMGKSWANSLNAWLAVHAFAKAAANVQGEVTAKSVSEYLDKPDTDIDVFGLVDWKPSAVGPKGYERFGSMQGYAVELKDGKLQTNPQVKPFDVVAAIS